MKHTKIDSSHSDEILNAFADLMAERVPDSPEEIDTLLREAGLDPMQIEAEVTALIAEARAKTRRDDVLTLSLVSA